MDRVLRKQITNGLIIIIILIVVFMIFGWLTQKMVYPAPWITVPTPPPAPLQEIELPIESGGRIIGWFFETSPEFSNPPIILYLHGNGENLATMWQSGLFEQLLKLDTHILAIDYPGYGRSSGSPSEQANVQAVKAAVQWIEEHFPEHPLVIWGWSLGAAVAVQTASEISKPLSGLILMSAWSSLSDVASVHYPGFLVSLVLREKYNSVEAARRVQCPALIIHGEADEIIPCSQGQQVAQAFPSPANWILLPEARHNDLLNFPQVWKEAGVFLSQIRNLQ